MQRWAYESDGVGFGLNTDRVEVSRRIAELLPPGAQPRTPSPEDETFGLVGDGDGGYTFTRRDSPVSTNLDLEFGLMMVQTQIRIYIGLEAPDRIFVHAGVVAVGDTGIVLPGRSFSGKTTLVAAFLRAGATYLSDEFAAFDLEGLVHPYPTPLSVREGDEERQLVDAAELGAELAGSAFRVGAVVVTGYQPGATWRPEPLTSGRAALALLDNTLAVLERPDEAMSVLKRVTGGCPLLLGGDRGEADTVVNDVLARVTGS